MFYQKSIQDILKQNKDLAKAGLRVLAFVIKNITMKILLSLVLFP